MKWKTLLGFAIAIAAARKLVIKPAPKTEKAATKDRSSNLFRIVDDRVNKIPELKYIVDNEYFVVCPFLSSNAFIKYCNERGLDVSREDLEQFERLGLFYPVAKVQHPQSYFWYRNDHVHTLFEGGLLWQPLTRPFQPWSSFKDEQNQIQVESFYSIFQCYPLQRLLQAIQLFQLSPAKLITLTLSQIHSAYKKKFRAKEWILEEHKVRNKFDLAAAICQVISNAYYPQTQSDRRTIRVTSSHFVGGWEWETYRRKWNAVEALNDIGIEVGVLKGLCYGLQVDAEQVDPLVRWHELVRFVSVDKKQRLRGDAQLALLLYSMHEMLNIFHEEITGTKVFLGETSPDKRDFIYGKGVTQNPLEYLEYLANEFHLNPRPRLILVVEGDGEYNEFPRLADEVLGYSFPEAGIEVRNLGGIGGFTGSQKRDKYGALEKYIDHNHDNQTYVYVVLDNEGGASQVKNALVKKQSELMKKRKVTRDEYIQIWNDSIEVDNFSWADIARALTEYCDHDHEFTADEVEASFQPVGGQPRKGNPLESLLNQQTGGRYSLNKVRLLHILCGYIISSTQEEFERKWSKSPIIKILNTVLTLAARNYQPQSEEAWKDNQESGYFGHVSGEREKKVKGFLTELRA
jgi:hypothetical protein